MADFTLLFGLVSSEVIK